MKIIFHTYPYPVYDDTVSITNNNIVVYLAESKSDRINIEFQNRILFQNTISIRCILKLMCNESDTNPAFGKPARGCFSLCLCC